MSIRKLTKTVPARPSTDGDGVRILRNLGDHRHDMDPFLMLDEIRSDDSADYIGGFPPHPHRGIETLTYMLSGGFVHEDSMGNKEALRDGGVQWMSAGSGVIHSELPLIREGLLHGFQLWINLPKARKMQKPDYAQAENAALPSAELKNGVQLRAIAGSWDIAGQYLSSPIAHPAANAKVLDIKLPAGISISVPVATQDTLLVYLFEGTLENAAAHGHQLLYFSEGDTLALQATSEGARVLVLSGTPLGEPIVQYGPFVMNTETEIQQAIAEYRSGQFIK